MIGKYLSHLDAAAEDRILTGRMEPGHYHQVLPGGARCLVGTAADFGSINQRADFFRYLGWMGLGPTKSVCRCACPVELRYDDLCHRLGADRANALIRDRILRARLNRELAGGRALAVAGASGTA